MLLLVPCSDDGLFLTLWLPWFLVLVILCGGGVRGLGSVHEAFGPYNGPFRQGFWAWDTTSHGEMDVHDEAEMFYSFNVGSERLEMNVQAVAHRQHGARGRWTRA